MSYSKGDFCLEIKLRKQYNAPMNEQINSLDQFRKDLADAMKDRKLSQIELAEKSGVSQSTISLFLTSKRGLSGDATLKLLPFVYLNESQATDTGPSCPSSTQT